MFSLTIFLKGGVYMTKRYSVILGIFFIFIFMTWSVIAQPAEGENDYRLAEVNPRITGNDTITADAGRGVWVANNPDLDNDGLPEIIVTEYTKGGRVFVFEVVGDDQIEYVWSSKKLHPGSGGGQTPRMATTGDFDNNGMQEIIFPVGYFTDSLNIAHRGIYFYEWTGNDNDYGTEPSYKLTYTAIDTEFVDQNVGRTESGLRVQDIDGDDKSELLFPPRAFDFSVAKLYILQVMSGTFAGGDAVIDTEYVYTDMVQVQNISPDGYVPAGTEIGDIDNDGTDEIIVAGWQNIGSGAGLGFIQIDGPDSYSSGSIIRLADFSAFIVKAKPLFTTVNESPVVYLHGTNAGTGDDQMWTLEGVVSEQFVTDANLNPLIPDLGAWSAWALGDQDHSTGGAGDGVDLYLGGGPRLYDIEYDGTGAITDPNSYDVSLIYDLSQEYSSVGGLFNDVRTYPGMDIDGDGLRDFVASYKGSSIDSLGDSSLLQQGFHVFLFEWGDSTQSISLSDEYTGIEAKPFKVVTPDNYELAQNYPNPFNPTTNISFTLPIKKEISLKIYNSLGQEVKTLINNREYIQGEHTVQWDGTDSDGRKVASGVYIYELRFGNFTKSKKMTLLR